jgi:MFS family permease
MTQHASNARFLWDWARKRERGRMRVIGLGAGVGAIGGAVFAIAMLAAIGPSIRFSEDSMSPWVYAFAQAVGPQIFMFVLALPAFAFIGAFVANRVWRMQEYRYATLLYEGATVPVTEPPRVPGENNAKIIMLVIVALVAIGAGFGIWHEINQGNL